MIYVYAIADRPQRPLPEQLGLNDAQLAKVVCRDIAAVVSACDDARLSNGADELWRHEAVVEALMRERTVLPVRFATLLPTPRHVAELLCRAYRALARDIARVRGRVEIGMRFLAACANDADADCACAVSDGDSPGGAHRGSAYLRAKLADLQHRRARRRVELRRVRDVYELLASHADASTLDGDPETAHAISAAFLVPRDGVEVFRNLVGEVAGAHPELALLCTGPWPPYSFVTTGPRTNSSDACHGR